MHIYRNEITGTTHVAKPLQMNVVEAVEHVLEFLYAFKPVHVTAIPFKRDRVLAVFTGRDGNATAKLSFDFEPSGPDACFSTFVTQLLRGSGKTVSFDIDEARFTWARVDSALLALLDDAVFDETICSYGDVQRLRTEWEHLLKIKADSVRPGSISGTHPINLPMLAAAV